MAALTATLIGLAIAGTVANAYGQVKAGQAAQKAGEANQAAADSQADLADYNASVADLQGKDAIERGAEQENRYRAQIRGAIGTQRAGIAAGGVDVSFGSAVDTQADAAYLGELDALTIRTNAAREQWGYQVQAYDYRKSADIARKTGVYAAESGQVAKQASYWGAAGSILGGTTSLLQMRYGFSK